MRFSSVLVVVVIGAFSLPSLVDGRPTKYGLLNEPDDAPVSSRTGHRHDTYAERAQYSSLYYDPSDETHGLPSLGYSHIPSNEPKTAPSRSYTYNPSSEPLAVPSRSYSRGPSDEPHRALNRGYNYSPSSEPQEAPSYHYGHNSNYKSQGAYNPGSESQRIPSHGHNYNPGLESQATSRHGYSYNPSGKLQGGPSHSYGQNPSKDHQEAPNQDFNFHNQDNLPQSEQYRYPDLSWANTPVEVEGAGKYQFGHETHSNYEPSAPPYQSAPSSPSTERLSQHIPWLLPVDSSHHHPSSQAGNRGDRRFEDFHHQSMPTSFKSSQSSPGEVEETSYEPSHLAPATEATSSSSSSQFPHIESFDQKIGSNLDPIVTASRGIIDWDNLPKEEKKPKMKWMRDNLIPKSLRNLKLRKGGK